MIGRSLVPRDDKSRVISEALAESRAAGFSQCPLFIAYSCHPEERGILRYQDRILMK